MILINCNVMSTNILNSTNNCVVCNDHCPEELLVFSCNQHHACIKCCRDMFTKTKLLCESDRPESIISLVCPVCCTKTRVLNITMEPMLFRESHLNSPVIDLDCRFCESSFQHIDEFRKHIRFCAIGEIQCRRGLCREPKSDSSLYCDRCTRYWRPMNIL